jgi:endonuclease/exonuclease/phosphatase (EEP) superfamily protein YafD
MLRAVEPDLVALQEVSELQGAALERELASAYPHRLLRGNGVAGKALFSRHPIEDHRELLLDCGRPHLEAEIEVEGRALGVIVAHVPLEHAMLGAFGPAFREVDLLAERAIRSAPALLVGDFNKTPFSFLYRRLRRQGLEDAFGRAGRGPGFTFPVFGRYKRIPLPPLVRIDYIWTTKGFDVIGCRVGLDGGSDHLPVVADLRLI